MAAALTPQPRLPDQAASRDHRSLDRILEKVRSFWGFDSLRPLQEEAINAVLESRDSVVVLPTGGGKSLCYQVPALVVDRTDIVVSPLISLMKDQVDGLRACGYPAAAIHSGLSHEQNDETVRSMQSGQLRLVFVSPERLLTPRFLGLLDQLNIRAFAIDEAHCISQWGHDFRKEYRQLALLKKRFPKASIHAYTATATQRVREDIAAQLELHNPTMLVGTFDRPNLVYRIVHRLDVYSQTIDIVRRHKDEGSIVYCLSRKDTEKMAAALRGAGINARAYHAGLSPNERMRTQEAFANESLAVVAATVAFGMGIDRSNVRCVIHATMPKSIEHYQQETGRAGRDGLEAECVLLYSAADMMRWQSLIKLSADASHDPAQFIADQTKLIKIMQRYCKTPQCRHFALSHYFGQLYPHDDCQACDVCLKETVGVKDATVMAQKILSSVARVERQSGIGFGIAYNADVLLGANTAKIRERGHDQVSTFGILRGTQKKQLTNWMYQMIDQDILQRTSGELPVLALNEASWEVMRGDRKVCISQAAVEPTKKRERSTTSRAGVAVETSWEGDDDGLYKHLRKICLALAKQHHIPTYMIFNDRTLRDLARRQPTNATTFRQIHGIGDAKLEKFGERFITEIATYCQSNDLSTGV